MCEERVAPGGGAKVQRQKQAWHRKDFSVWLGKGSRADKRDPVGPDKDFDFVLSEFKTTRQF